MGGDDRDEGEGEQGERRRAAGGEKTGAGTRGRVSGNGESGETGEDAGLTTQVTGGGANWAIEG